MTDVEDLRDRFEDLESRVEELEAQVSGSLKFEKESSLVEFVKNESSASTHKEKLVAIGYYLEAYEDQDSFTTGHIEDAYDKMGEKKTNFSARASEAMADGWIELVEEGPPQEFEVTRTGISIVEDLLE